MKMTIPVQTTVERGKKCAAESHGNGQRPPITKLLTPRTTTRSKAKPTRDKNTMTSKDYYYETKKNTTTSRRKKVVATFASTTVPKMMMILLVLYLQILLFATAQQEQQQEQQQKTRSLPRVTTPEEVWKHIKIRTVDELKEILEKLEINIEEDDIDVDDEDELRTYIYDEEIMELWLKTYPEEVMRLKPPPPPPPPSPKQEDPPVVPPSDSSSPSTKDDQKKKTNPIENLIQSGSKFIKNLWGGNKDEL